MPSKSRMLIFILHRDVSGFLASQCYYTGLIGGGGGVTPLHAPTPEPEVHYEGRDLGA